MATTTHTAPWDAIGISKATYYRRKKVGNPLKKEESHKALVNDWVIWRESGLIVRPWASTHKKLQLCYIEKYFKHFRSITASSLEEWLGPVPVESFSKRKHMHCAVSSFAKYLHYRDVIAGAEYLKIKALSPKRSPYRPPRQRIIYEEDLDTLIATALKGHQRYQRLLNVTLLIFLSETGLRVSEACALLRQDLRFSHDPKNAAIIVRSGKGGKRRIVPFSKRAQDTVAEYLEHAPGGEKVFYSFNPKTSYQPLDRHAAARRFQAIALKTGIDFCPHSLRHYRITKWANNPRIPIAVTQKWAGHSSLEVTQKYIHIRDEEALAAAFI